MIGRKEIYIGVIDGIDIIYKIIVKLFLLFITKLAIYKDRYQIRYTAGNLYPKIFFSSKFFQIIINYIS